MSFQTISMVLDGCKRFTLELSGEDLESTLAGTFLRIQTNGSLNKLNLSLKDKITKRFLLMN